jgi:hypothetical protein
MIPNQGLDAFLDYLRQAIAARGIPTRSSLQRDADYIAHLDVFRRSRYQRLAACLTG